MVETDGKKRAVRPKPPKELKRVQTKEGITIIVVEDAPCPECGQGYPNRPKQDNWWKCYKESCPVGYYDPVTGDVQLDPAKQAAIKAKGKDLIDQMFPQPPASEWKDKKVYARDGKLLGFASGHTKKCMLEGCRSHKVHVRWPSGRRTWPCAAGLVLYKDGYRIG
jgi:hypothetical protein